MLNIYALSKRLFFLTCCAIILVYLYSFRAFYKEPFDAAYIRDLFDHSQWQVPHHVRSISDELLYQTAGDNLVKNGDFITINAEAPPLGKYIYGLSIEWFNNPYLVCIALFLLTLWLFYELLRVFRLSFTTRAIAVLLFLSEPLLFLQLKATMLDFFQLFWLLGYSLILLELRNNATRSKQITLSLLCGGLLGFFLATKIGLFAIPVFVTSAYFLYQLKLLRLIPLILASAATFYLLSYVSFFTHGGTFHGFLAMQKWMVNFYTSSKAIPQPLMPIVVLITGFIKGWSDNATWERVVEWMPLWIFYVWALWKSFRSFYSLPLVQRYVALLTISLLITYFMVPFFFRYLILIMPFLIILFVYHIQPLVKKASLPRLLTLFVVYWVVFSAPHLLGSLRTVTDNLEKLWNVGAYQDAYMYVDAPPSLNRYSLWENVHRLTHDLDNSVMEIHIAKGASLVLKDSVKLPAVITYTNELGVIHQNTTVEFKRKENQWKLIWRDDLLLPHYKFGDSIKTSLDNGRYGTLMWDATVLAKEGNAPFITLLPSKIHDEKLMQRQLSTLSGLDKYELEGLYKANHPDTIPIAVGFVVHHKKILPKEPLDPSITISDKLTLTYSSFTHEKNLYSRVDKAFNLYRKELFPEVGGTITHTHNGEEILLLQKRPKDGSQVTITDFLKVIDI